jgi:hypothetical protein
MSQFRAIMERIAQEFPLPTASHSGESHEGEGGWDGEILEEWLLAMQEEHAWFEFDKTSRRDGWRIYCPGNTDEGWPDGATHSEFYSQPNDSSIVYIENGLPCLSCKHNGCGDGAKQGRKRFRHLLDALDPARRSFNYPNSSTLKETLELLTYFAAEEVLLPPEYRYKLIYTATKYGRIYSNDGRTWYTASGTRVE